jgi:hypothetical protein
LTDWIVSQDCYESENLSQAEARFPLTKQTNSIYFYPKHAKQVATPIVVEEYKENP